MCQLLFPNFLVIESSKRSIITGTNNGPTCEEFSPIVISDQMLLSTTL